MSKFIEIKVESVEMPIRDYTSSEMCLIKAWLSKNKVTHIKSSGDAKYPNKKMYIKGN